MKQTFAFISPVVDSTQSAIRTEAYEQGVDLYNRGEYVQAFHSLLDYLNAVSHSSWFHSCTYPYCRRFFPYQCRFPESAGKG